MKQVGVKMEMVEIKLFLNVLIAIPRETVISGSYVISLGSFSNLFNVFVCLFLTISHV